MKLYDVPRNTYIQLPCGTRLLFDHIDGMYSLCFTEDGQPCHIAAWQDVTIADVAIADVVLAGVTIVNIEEAGNET